MASFCKLADPDRYIACSWNLATDEAGRNHWVPFFKRHLNMILQLGIESAAARGHSETESRASAYECRKEFYAKFDAFMQNPEDYGQVTILTLDNWRDDF